MIININILTINTIIINMKSIFKLNIADVFLQKSKQGIQYTRS